MFADFTPSIESLPPPNIVIDPELFGCSVEQVSETSREITSLKRQMGRFISLRKAQQQLLHSSQEERQSESLFRLWRPPSKGSAS